MICFIETDILQILDNSFFIGITGGRRTFGNTYKFANSFWRNVHISIDDCTAQVSLEAIVTYDLSVATGNFWSVAYTAA